MQIIIQGHGTNVTATMRDYASKKIGKLQHFFDNVQKVEVTLDARCNDDLKRHHVAEVTVWAAGKRVIRASEGAADMYAAIDVVADEVDRQLKKHKEKFIEENRRKSKKAKESMREISMPVPSAGAPTIVLVDRFPSKPLLPEEAIEELKLAKEDFMLFFNPETKTVNLVYKNGGDYTVVNSEEEKLMTYSPDEAISEIGRSRNNFVMFLNRDTNGVSVLYKRSSGNFGLIEPMA